MPRDQLRVPGITRPCHPQRVALSTLDNAGQGTLQNAENGTPYSLTVTYAGSVERKITVAPNENGSIALPAGSYRVAGQVASQNVLPFYGTQSYNDHENCSTRFYLH